MIKPEFDSKIPISNEMRLRNNTIESALLTLLIFAIFVCHIKITSKPVIPVGLINHI